MSIDRRGALRAATLFLAVAIAPAHAQRPQDDIVIAVANDRAGEVKSLLAKGVDPNTTDPNGDPLLYTAARAGYGATVDALLATKVDVDARNRYGDTPMMGAALEGHLDVMKKLRARGAALDYKGWTPLIYAAAGGRDPIVVWLLDQGASINALSPNGTTALMMAVREGKGSTVELLVKRGADVNHRNENNVSALDWAKRGNETAMAQLLRKAGAKD